MRYRVKVLHSPIVPGPAPPHRRLDQPRPRTPRMGTPGHAARRPDKAVGMVPGVAPAPRLETRTLAAFRTFGASGAPDRAEYRTFGASGAIARRRLATACRGAR